MNEYIKNRIVMEKEGLGGEVDERGQNGLWDWAGEIASLSLDEVLAEDLQCQIYYALQETFKTLYKGA